MNYQLCTHNLNLGRDLILGTTEIGDKIVLFLLGPGFKYPKKYIKKSFKNNQRNNDRNIFDLLEENDYFTFSDIK